MIPKQPKWQCPRCGWYFDVGNMSKRQRSRYDDTTLICLSCRTDESLTWLRYRKFGETRCRSVLHPLWGVQPWANPIPKD